MNELDDIFNYEKDDLIILNATNILGVSPTTLKQVKKVKVKTKKRLILMNLSLIIRMT